MKLPARKEAIMAVAPERTSEGICFLDADESRQFFDSQARRLMDMTGPEFLSKLDAGAFAGEQDDRVQRAVMKLTMLRSFGR